MEVHGLAHLVVVWLISASSLMVTSFLVPGFRLKNFGSAMTAAAVIAGVNFFLRPLLLFLAFPLTFLTLGLFVFVVDAILLRLSAWFLREFAISGWLSAIFAAFLNAILNAILTSVFF